MNNEENQDLHPSDKEEKEISSAQDDQFSREQIKAIETVTAINNQFASGANWFFWISGLSLINSAVTLFGGQINFVIGLGITQIIDSIASLPDFQNNIVVKIIAFVIDLVISGIFIACGILARHKQRWAFIVGIVLYGIDTLLFLVIQDVIGIAFHVFALYCLYSGLKACNALMALEKSAEEENSQLS